MQASDSPVIRCVEHLRLSRENEALANRLLGQIDMPVVFWMESEADKNYRQRHPLQKNEYWIVVKPQTDENERIRLILAGLHTAIQVRRRYWNVIHHPVYKEALIKQGDQRHIAVYEEFPNSLNSIAGTLDAEWYLAQYGISTSTEVRQLYFQDRINKLNEYISLHHPRNDQPILSWYREIEVTNLIEYGNYYRLGGLYQKKLKELLPKVESGYLAEVEKVAKTITDLQLEYNGTNGFQLTERFMTTMIEQFDLGNMLQMYLPETYDGTYPLGWDTYANVFSYIPYNWPRQDDLICWLRMARELICTFRNSQDPFPPDVTINLIDTNLCNSYADGTQKTGYCISFTSGLVFEITDLLQKWAISKDNERLLRIIGEQEFRRQLLRQVIYLITAHEYAHILNGDCDCSLAVKYSDLAQFPEDRSEIEDRADIRAKKIIEDAALLLYRFPPAPKGEHEQIHAALLQGRIPAIPHQRLLEIEKEVQEFRFKLARDKTIAIEAQKFIAHFRQVSSSIHLS